MSRILLNYTAYSWALFQLAVASFWNLDASYIVQIHLSFAITISFLIISQKNYLRKYWNKLFLCLALSPWLFLTYYLYDVESFSFRASLPNNWDITIGLLFIGTLLFHTYINIGKGIIIVSIVFLFTILFASHLPSFLAFSDVSIPRMIGQVYMTDQGIFGIPLDISASIVFLFVFLGSLLSKSGGGEFFINLALSLVGHYRGGAAKAAIVGSGMTGLISGSSIANIATTGTFTIPLMKKSGYSAEKAAAIEVAASTDGQLAPPIMGAAAFIIASTLQITYFEVIKAAFIPAFVSSATLFFITHIEATKNNIQPFKKGYFGNFFDLLKQGVHFLIPIIILIYQLIIVRSTASYSVLSAIITFVIIIYLRSFLSKLNSNLSIQKKISSATKIIGDSCVMTAKSMLVVALATATAGIIVAVISLGLGAQVHSILETLSMGNIFLLLFFTAIISLIVGMGLPTTATYIVIASLTAPIIVSYGDSSQIIIPAIAAHLFCFYFGILADDTPPVGLAAYTASAIAQSDPTKTSIQSFLFDIRTAILPFMFIFNTDLILHQKNNLLSILLILVMTCLASFCFTAIIQKFFIIKNTLWDTFLLTASSTILFLPNRVAQISPFDIHYYWYYLLGLAFLLLIIKSQVKRKCFA